MRLSVRCVSAAVFLFAPLAVTPLAATPAAAAPVGRDSPAVVRGVVRGDVGVAPLRRILVLVNHERAKAGRRPLASSQRLEALAQAFSDDMARRDFFSHTDPDGCTPWDRAARRGIHNLGGENIARGYADVRAVMDAWMHSPGHRANILNPAYKTLGVGMNPAADGPWWTQDFGYRDLPPGHRGHSQQAATRSRPGRWTGHRRKSPHSGARSGRRHLSLRQARTRWGTSCATRQADHPIHPQP
jgi:hypothetical protein